MATIQLPASGWEWYKNGVGGQSAVVGYENNARRVGRHKFTAASSGASSLSVTIYSGGKGGGNHIPIKFYIGTDPDSHANAGPGSTATGTFTLGDDWLTFTASANMILLPNQVYYLWIFPGEDTFGWYWGTRANYTSAITTSGAAMSSISGSNGTLGSVHTLELTRYSSALTHTISATCGKESLTIKTGVQADSITWTPPIAWAAQNTTGTSVPVRITCTTYNGSTPVGSISVALTFAIPSSVVPSVDMSVYDPNGHTNRFVDFVQSKSTAKVEVSGSGVYGSTIQSYQIIFIDTKVTGSVAVFGLPNYGQFEISAIVTDSRGRTARTAKTITVLPYFIPTATILTAYRSDSVGNQDDNGKYATVVFNANVSPVGNRNTAAYTVKYRIRGSTAWTNSGVSSAGGDYSPSNVLHIIPISLDEAYEVCVSAADWFTYVDSLYRTIQVAFSLLSVNRTTKSVGIGQKATEAGMCAFGIPAKFNAGVNVNGKILMFAYNESIGGYVLMEAEG